MSYRIYSGTTTGVETFLLNPGNVTNYTITGLTNGQMYYFKVQAVNTVGYGINSTEQSAMPATTPSTPMLMVNASGIAKITLNWTTPASNGGSAITFYLIYQGTTSGGETFAAMLSSSQHTYSISSLTIGQTYFFKVAAVNDVGIGANSTEASATTITVPTAPLTLSATAGNNQVTLNWTAPTSNGGSLIIGYIIYRGLSVGSEVLYTNVSNVLTFTDTGLTNGQAYYYKVRAANSVGESALSAEATATPISSTSTPGTSTPGYPVECTIGLLAIACMFLAAIERRKCKQ